MSLTEVQTLLCLGLIASTGIPANSESLSASHRLNGSTTRKAFMDSQEAAFASTVRLMRNGKLITHGTIISEEGYLLTKASACVGAREAVFANGKKYPVRIRRRGLRVGCAAPFQEPWFPEALTRCPRQDY